MKKVRLLVAILALLLIAPTLLLTTNNSYSTAESVPSSPLTMGTNFPFPVNLTTATSFPWMSGYIFAAGDNGWVGLYHLPTDAWFNYGQTGVADNWKTIAMSQHMGVVIGGDSLESNIRFSNGNTEGWASIPQSRRLGGTVERIVSDGNWFLAQNASNGKHGLHYHGGGTYQWMPASRLPIGLEGHTASLLGDGRVLVYGGTQLNGVESNVPYTYDPTTTRWTMGAAHDPGRTNHTATVLDNGNVLIAGGYNISLGGSLPRLSLYNMATSTMTTFPAMPTPRHSHNAVLLANGTLAVYGGRRTDGTPVKDFELFDINGMLWISLPTIPGDPGRVWSTTVLLKDNNVLVAGGMDAMGNPLRDAWIYNTTTNTWARTGDLKQARYHHGTSLIPKNESVLVSGGIGPGGMLSSCELYNPETGEWNYTGSLATRRYGHNMVEAWDGKLIALGGYSDIGADATVQFYNSDDDSWYHLFSMEYAREETAAVRLESGKIMIVGGTLSENPGSDFGLVEILDWGWGDWYKIGGLPGSFTTTGVERGTKNYYISGVDAGSPPDSRNQIYTLNGTQALLVHSQAEPISRIALNPVDETILLYEETGAVKHLTRASSTMRYSLHRISQVGLRPSAREGHAAASTGAYTLIFSGFDGMFLQDTWLYNHIADTWHDLNPTSRPQARDGASMVFHPPTNSFILFGGRTGASTYRQDTWSFNLSTMDWTQLTPAVMPPIRAGAGMVYNPEDDMLYLFGGTFGETDFRGDTWKLDPSVPEWQSLGITGPTSRAHHMMVYDEHNGEMLMFGGRNAGGMLGETWTLSGEWINRTGPGDPPPRYAAAASRSDIFGGILLMGGRSAVGLSDAYVYDPATREWSSISMEQPMEPMWSHTMHEHHNGLFTFGGRNNTARNNNIHMAFGDHNISFRPRSLIGLPQSATINSIAWSSDGQRAVLVGNVGSIYSYTAGDFLVANHTDPGITYDLTTIVYRPPSSPGMFFIVGLHPLGGSTPVLLYDTWVTSEIRTDVYEPHVNKLDLLSHHTPGTENGDVVVTNSQVDAGSTYWIRVNLSHDLGLSYMSNLTVYLWHDQGGTGLASNYPGGVMNNTQVAFYGDLTIPGHSWSIVEDSGLGEFEILGWDSTGNDTHGSAYLKIRFGWQVRAAGGMFSEMPGTANPSQNDQDMALNDADTWDMKAVAFDIYDNSKSAWDEFGVYRMLMLTVSGLQGNQHGQGAPGQNITLQPTGDITFSANCPYRLNVTVTNLVGVNDPTKQIDAEYMGIKGGNLQGPHHMGTNRFLGADIPQNLLGLVPAWQPPNDSDTITNTTNARDATVGEVVWVCHTPPVPEDTYRGTARYTLHHDG